MPAVVTNVARCLEQLRLITRNGQACSLAVLYQDIAGTFRLTVRVKAVVVGRRHGARVLGLGLRSTWPIGLQFRVERVQRSGFARRAPV